MRYSMIISLANLVGCASDCGCTEDREEKEHFGPNPGGNGPIKPPQA